MKRVVRALTALLIFVHAVALHAGSEEETMPAWKSDAPPGKFDWVRIKSDEWFKGELLGMYDDELEFDSVEMELKTFDWADVREVRTAQVMEVGLLDGATAVGKLVMIGNRVIVNGDATLEFQRSQVLSITRWAQEKRLKKWGGKLSLGLTVMQGNVDEVDSNINGRLRRRSVRDRAEVDYIANLNSNEGTTTSDNQRLNADWDHFITDRFFVTPVVLEWYRDPFQNLSSRTTAGSGLGYQIIDKPRMSWEVTAGLAYQVTVFEDVDVGTDTSERTAALSASTQFSHDWTKIVEFDWEYRFHLTSEESGRYNHHMVTSIETDWTDMLDFDISLVWDRIQIPQRGADGVLPEQDDFRMVIALGLEF